MPKELILFILVIMLAGYGAVSFINMTLQSVSKLITKFRSKGGE